MFCANGNVWVRGVIPSGVDWGGAYSHAKVNYDDITVRRFCTIKDVFGSEVEVNRKVEHNESLKLTSGRGERYHYHGGI